MTAKIRFFARFRELLGTDIIVDVPADKSILALVKHIAQKNPEGYDAIFDEHDAFKEFVIVMQNGKRLENTDAATANVHDGDEIAIFPPVAGG